MKKNQENTSPEIQALRQKRENLRSESAWMSAILERKMWENRNLRIALNIFEARQARQQSASAGSQLPSQSEKK